MSLDPERGTRGRDTLQSKWQSRGAWVEGEQVRMVVADLAWS